jgi:hypothetical protein
MTAAPLSPEAALGWLGSLFADLRAVAVLDAAGAVLAGDPRLASRVGAGSPAERGDGADASPGPAVDPGVAAGAGGDLLVVRSGRHAIAAVVGPGTLRRLALADLRSALEALESA